MIASLSCRGGADRFKHSSILWNFRRCPDGVQSKPTANFAKDDVTHQRGLRREALRRDAFSDLPALVEGTLSGFMLPSAQHSQVAVQCRQILGWRLHFACTIRYVSMSNSPARSRPARRKYLNSRSPSSCATPRPAFARFFERVERLIRFLQSSAPAWHSLLAVHGQPPAERRRSIKLKIIKCFGIGWIARSQVWVQVQMNRLAFSCVYY